MADLKLLFDSVIRLETELWNGVDATLRAACDLPMTWLDILRLLDRTGGCRVQDMADEFAITVGGASKVADRVEAAGYCARRANPDDRRSSIVELTPAGRGKLEQALEVFEEELRLRFAPLLDDREAVDLIATLDRLRSACRAADASRGGGRKPVPAMREPQQRARQERAEP
ncbi:MarR family winged helix-turn-helix transcriptional regulator [Streptomyces sp. NPDC093600]|uniref:MarR family winged helix-turn-helix transcriptional regulator n=1 Tax=Streptomyces sp. NPDC093600 TaxID=3366047 RepID=UPI00382278AB